MVIGYRYIRTLWTIIVPVPDSGKARNENSLDFAWNCYCQISTDSKGLHMKKNKERRSERMALPQQEHREFFVDGHRAVCKVKMNSRNFIILRLSHDIDSFYDIWGARKFLVETIIYTYLHLLRIPVMQNIYIIGHVTAGLVDLAASAPVSAAAPSILFH